MRNVGRFGISLQRSVIPAGLLCFQGFVVGCSEAETRDPDATGPTKMPETASVEGREEGVWPPQRAIRSRHRGLERRSTWRRSAERRVGKTVSVRVCFGGRRHLKKQI